MRLHCFGSMAAESNFKIVKKIRLDVSDDDTEKLCPLAAQFDIPISEVPCRLCHWTKRHIEYLGIKTSFQFDKTPFDFITSPIPCTGEIGIRVLAYDVERMIRREKEKKEKVSLISEFVKRSGFLDVIQNLYYTSFEDLNIDSVMKLHSYKDHCFVPKGLPSNLDEWFRRFDTYGKIFMYVLSRLVENVMQGIPNREVHFQHLFDTLVKMFGMQSGLSFEPCPPVQCLKIGNVEVQGSPDILYTHHRINESKRKVEKPRIIAVCKVSRHKPMPPCRTEITSSSKSRGKSAETEQIPTSSTASENGHYPIIAQLSEEMIGQHCGELLLKYSQSIGHGSIFGIVVQQTQVTLTELRMTETQYQNIKAGNFTHREIHKPSFMYTRPYNFMKMEDLEKLVEPFIMFGLEP